MALLFPLLLFESALYLVRMLWTDFFTNHGKQKKKGKNNLRGNVCIIFLPFILFLNLLLRYSSAFLVVFRKL